MSRAETAAVLAGAGHRPGRDVGDERLGALLRTVTERFAEEGHPVEAFPAARAFVRAYGGLRFDIPGTPPDAVGLTPHWIYEESGEDVAELAGALGTRLFPVGYTTFDGAMLLLDETGRFFLLHHTGPYHLGDDLHEAVSRLLRGPEVEARTLFPTTDHQAAPPPADATTALPPEQATAAPQPADATAAPPPAAPPPPPPDGCAPPASASPSADSP
ncbi:SUKH-3 domain-containing protein [Streptomyces sp. NPDC012421]|uniref:SUKH-3 domain-containing protein n=1 Tax=Streptomyces sp. NPDC012421 TaxID=3364832 RepID=UPI0036E0E217